MKSFDLFLVFLNMLLIICLNPADSKLTMEETTYKILSEAATKTFKQLFGLSINFDERIQEGIENDKMKLEVTLYDDFETPSEEQQTRFEIVNGKASTPEIEVKEKLSLFGNTYNIKEQYKIISNMIANGYKNGYVIIYKKSNESGVVAQSRYKCFVKSDEGQEIGSFEIVQIDKNDKKTIINTLTNFFKILGVVNDDVKIISELVSSFAGIVRDIKSMNFSPYLKLPFLSLLFIFCLL